MSGLTPTDNSYRVEVSGWDELEHFFVENTSLSWSASDDKQISLHSRILEGSIVFVRLLPSVANLNNVPVAYQVTRLQERNEEGNSAVWIEQLHPRREKRETIVDLLTKEMPPVH